jgi:hypothetical protein
MFVFSTAYRLGLIHPPLQLVEGLMLEDEHSPPSIAEVRNA